jgi:hypothetical protein
MSLQRNRPAVPQSREARPLDHAVLWLNDSDRSFWFLGPATYQGHVGEKPMAITCKLHTPLSGDLYQSFAAAVA